MKITIYELLGLVKDGKAPKKIEAYHYFWEWNKNKEDYVKSGEQDFRLFEDYLEDAIIDSLNDIVEILEEQKKIPEKLDIKDIYSCDDYQQIHTNFKSTWHKINEIIDYLKSKGDE